MEWDEAYEAACNIIQAFSEEYPTPHVLVVTNAFLKAYEITGESDIHKLIQWAKDYAEWWYKKYVK